MRTLNMLSPGEHGIIARVHGHGQKRAIRRRLLDMGFTRGTPVIVHKPAPLGDPLELELRGYSLTLRKQEAALVELA